MLGLKTAAGRWLLMNLPVLRPYLGLALQYLSIVRLLLSWPIDMSLHALQVMVPRQLWLAYDGPASLHLLACSKAHSSL